MGMRIHGSYADTTGVAYLDTAGLVEYDDELEARPALVIEDAGNQEAFVIYGTPGEVRAFLLKALAATDSVPTMDVDFSEGETRLLTPSESAYLAHIADEYDCEATADDVSIDEAGIAWWDSPDSTTFDLTNEMPRSRSIERD